MLIAECVIDTLAINPHVLHQILDRRSLVTARPENLHRLVEDFISIELFLARHSCCLGYSLYSFWNEQSRIQQGYSRPASSLTANQSAPIRTTKGERIVRLNALTSKAAFS